VGTGTSEPSFGGEFIARPASALVLVTTLMRYPAGIIDKGYVPTLKTVAKQNNRNNSQPVSNLKLPHLLVLGLLELVNAQRTLTREQKRQN